MSWSRADFPVFQDYIERNPFGGIDKPAPLKYLLAGYCSRRIDDCLRLAHRGKRHDIDCAKPGLLLITPPANRTIPATSSADHVG